MPWKRQTLRKAANAGRYESAEWVGRRPTKWQPTIVDCPMFHRDARCCRPVGSHPLKRLKRPPLEPWEATPPTLSAELTSSFSHGLYLAWLLFINILPPNTTTQANTANYFSLHYFSPASCRALHGAINNSAHSYLDLQADNYCVPPTWTGDRITSLPHRGRQLRHLFLTSRSLVFCLRLHCESRTPASLTRRDPTGAGQNTSTQRQLPSRSNRISPSMPCPR